MGVIIPYLKGGLGDQLFQIAVAVKLASGSGNKYAIIDEMLKGASRIIISKMFICSGAFTVAKKFTRVLFDTGVPSYEKCVKFLSTYSNTTQCVYLHCSIQNHVFIPEKFNEMLSLPPIGGPQEASACFIHIDKECTDEYYSRSIHFMRGNHDITNFIVFTDIVIRDTPKWLEGIDYQIMKYNEVQSLALMARCKAGIASTESLSWWGAYLNPHRPICMPSNFPGSEYSPQYFFPGVYVVPV